MDKSKYYIKRFIRTIKKYKSVEEEQRVCTSEMEHKKETVKAWDWLMNFGFAY